MARSATPYDATFFAHQRHGSRATAEVVLPWLLAWTGARTLVDVGCGAGTWVAVAHRLGIEAGIGIDGAHVPVTVREVGRSAFLVADLAAPLRLAASFDVALCLEVAEHLPPTRADGLVADLVALAPVVLFSAAAPGQGGIGHVHEAWPEAWARRFAAHRFRWFDPVRPRLWARPDLPWWYAQNTLLYAHEEHVAGLAAAARVGPEASAWPLPLVHPAAQHRLERRVAPTWRNAWRAVRRAVRGAPADGRDG